MKDTFLNDDLNTSISFFKEKVKEFVEKRGWTKYHSPNNLVQAINCEAGELSQLFLFKDNNKEDILKNIDLITNIGYEIADVFIYLISLVNSLDLDLTNVFLKKMNKNEQKYSIEEFNDGNYHKK